MGDDTRKWETVIIEAAKKRKKEEAERARIINDPEGFVNEETPVDKRNAKRRKIRKKRNEMEKRMKKVAALALLSAGAILSLLGKSVYEKLKGEEYILDTFTSSDDRYDKISVADFSNGLSVAMTDKGTGETKYVSIDDAVNYIRERARNEGMSEAEACVVVSSYLSDVVAKQAFPSVSGEDVTNAKESAYYKLKLAGRGASFESRQADADGRGARK